MKGQKGEPPPPYLVDPLPEPTVIKGKKGPPGEKGDKGYRGIHGIHGATGDRVSSAKYTKSTVKIKPPESDMPNHSVFRLKFRFTVNKLGLST